MLILLVFICLVSFSMSYSSSSLTLCPTASWTFSSDSRGQLRSCFCPPDGCDPDCVFLPECSPPKGLDFLFIPSDLTCPAACLATFCSIDLVLLSLFLIHLFLTGNHLPHGCVFWGYRFKFWNLYLTCFLHLKMQTSLVAADWSCQYYIKLIIMMFL